MSLSKHIVGLASGAASVSGTLTVDTGLEELDEAIACLGEDSVAADAIVSVTKVTRVAGTTARILITVQDEDGVTAGTGPTLVRWIAVGR